MNFKTKLETFEKILPIYYESRQFYPELRINVTNGLGFVGLWGISLLCGYDINSQMLKLNYIFDICIAGAGILIFVLKFVDTAHNGSLE
ncbi:MAG: hypothetical protein LBE12_16020 [Planctomycetaceae bacterium]|jgi:hypothetical protein|nr:hypothetical protein [Planctomycetaceae bacterium]